MSPSIHVWSRCHHCGMSPVVGPCVRCQTCPIGPEIDLCAHCYEGYRSGDVVHPSPASGSFLAADLRMHRFVRTEGQHPERIARWLSIPGATHAPPPVPERFLVRPRFYFGQESAFAGYGFIIRFEDHAVLLTALHAMDELIKIKGIDATAANPHYTGKELPACVDSIRLYDVLKERWMLHELGKAGPMMVLPNARTADEEPLSSRDIAAFRVDLPGTSSAPLAPQEPTPGETVWLAAAMPDGTRTRRATCVEMTPRSFIFRYEEPKETPRHTSGAPILDRHGAVVGINTGFGRLAGHELGYATPLASIRAHLEDARAACISL